MNSIKKIFITGEKKIGKSSFLKYILKKSNINLEGFFTQRIYLNNGQEVAYRLMDISRDKDYCIETTYDALKDYNNVFLIRAGDRITYRNIDVFNDFAVNILARAIENKSDVILLDEIGFIEETANVYRRMLKDVLNSNIKVLGVLQKKSSGLIREVTHHNDVCVYELNDKSKDGVEQVILRYLENK